MIKSFFLLILLLNNICYSHDHVPGVKNENSTAGTMRVFYKVDTYSTMLEIKRAQQYGLTQNKFKIGSYLNLKKSEKLGFFLSNSNGLRHSDDWVKSSSNNWFWKDTTSRSETSLMLSYLKRYRSSLLSNIIYTLRGDFNVNTYNSNQVLILTPTLSYFITKSSVPKFSFHTKLSFYKAINFDSQEIYKWGLYQSALIHYSKNVSLGASLKYFVENWSASSDFNADFTNESYKASDVSTILGIELIFKI